MLLPTSRDWEEESTHAVIRRDDPHHDAGMYRDPTAGSVVVGEPGNALSTRQEKDPYRSKIGGKPVSHDIPEMHLILSQ